MNNASKAKATYIPRYSGRYANNGASFQFIRVQKGYIGAEEQQCSRQRNDVQVEELKHHGLNVNK